MKGLMLKDFYTFGNFRKSLLFQLAIVAVFSIAMPNVASVIMMMVVVMAGTLMISTFAYDESAKWDRYALALPVSRRTVVSAKYLTGLLIQLVLSAGAFILSAGLAAIRQQTTEGILSAAAALAVIFCMSLVSQAVGLAVAFKLGAEKARMANVFAYLLFFGIVMLVVFLLRDRLETLSTGLVLAAGGLVLGLCALLYLASYFLAVRFYTRREF